jgi:hypothetical protein
VNELFISTQSLPFRGWDLKTDITTNWLALVCVVSILNLSRGAKAWHLLGAL